MQATLAEALRVLGTGGQLVILDSPIYNDAESGRKMVQEREVLFTRKYGFPSNSIKSKNFFTYSGLESLGRPVHIDIQALPECQADSSLLKQVWINLIANALKYSPHTLPR